MKFILRTTLGKTNMHFESQRGPFFSEDGLMCVEANTEEELRNAIWDSHGPMSYDGIGFDHERPTELCVFFEQADLQI